MVLNKKTQREPFMQLDSANSSLKRSLVEIFNSVSKVWSSRAVNILNILLELIPIFSENNRVVFWCYVSTNTVKRIFLVGSHTGQRLGLRNGSYCSLKSRPCFVPLWLCGTLGLFMVSLWSGQPGTWPMPRAGLWMAGCRLYKETLLPCKLWGRPLGCSVLQFCLATLSHNKLFLNFHSRNSCLKMLKSQAKVSPVKKMLLINMLIVM